MDKQWKNFIQEQLLKNLHSFVQDFLKQNQNFSELEFLESAYKNLPFASPSLMSYLKVICFFELNKFQLLHHEVNYSNLKNENSQIYALALIVQGLAYHRASDLKASFKVLKEGFQFFDHKPTNFVKDCLQNLYIEALYVYSQGLKSFSLPEALSNINLAIELNNETENSLVGFLYALRAEILLELFGPKYCFRAWQDVLYAEKMLCKFQKNVFLLKELKEKTENMRRQKQNKNGYVYVLSYNEDSGLKYYKIGCSLRPEYRNKRLSSLSAFPTKLIHIIECKNMFKTERYFHNKFANRRLNGEWFALTNDDLNYLKSFKYINNIPKQLFKMPREELF